MNGKRSFGTVPESPSLSLFVCLLVCVCVYEHIITLAGGGTLSAKCKIQRSR